LATIPGVRGDEERVSEDHLGRVEGGGDHVALDLLVVLAPLYEIEIRSSSSLDTADRHEDSCRPNPHDGERGETAL
jgi:hypothetical protein